MSNVKIISQARKIEAGIDMLKRYEKDQKALREKCPHNIVLVTHKDIWEYTFEAICVCCGKEFSSPSDNFNKDGIILDLTLYMMNNKVDKKQLLDEVRSLYCDISQEKSLSKKDIKMFFEEYYECKENPYDYILYGRTKNGCNKND